MNLTNELQIYMKFYYIENLEVQNFTQYKIIYKVSKMSFTVFTIFNMKNIKFVIKLIVYRQ